jgi:hypothetical protein
VVATLRTSRSVGQRFFGGALCDKEDRPAPIPTSVAALVAKPLENRRYGTATWMGVDLPLSCPEIFTAVAA